MLAGALAVFVSEKFAVVSPVALAVTVYGPPAVAFAVNGADATPDAFVATTIVAVLLLNTPDAPDPGAERYVHPGNRVVPRVLYRHCQRIREGCVDRCRLRRRPRVRRHRRRATRTTTGSFECRQHRAPGI